MDGSWFLASDSMTGLVVVMVVVPVTVVVIVAIVAVVAIVVIVVVVSYSKVARLTVNIPIAGRGGWQRGIGLCGTVFAFALSRRSGGCCVAAVV